MAWISFMPCAGSMTPGHRWPASDLVVVVATGGIVIATAALVEAGIAGVVAAGRVVRQGGGVTAAPALVGRRGAGIGPGGGGRDRFLPEAAAAFEGRRLR